MVLFFLQKQPNAAPFPPEVAVVLLNANACVIELILVYFRMQVLCVCFSVLLYMQSAFCVGDSADLLCLLDVTRCLQSAAAAAGGLSAQTESAGGIKGPSPKKATGVGLCLVCSLCCLEICGCILTLAACAAQKSA